MPVAPTYPGVYIDELPSAVRTITGVPTAIAAFVGPALRGPVDDARHITSWADFERIFGGLLTTSLMSYAVYHYYQNGGTEAEVVRIAKNAVAATLDLGNGVTLAAKYPGDWATSKSAQLGRPASGLRARVTQTADQETAKTYTLTIRDMGSGAQEQYLNVSFDKTSPLWTSSSLGKLLASSVLVTSTGAVDQLPTPSSKVDPGKDPFADPPPAPAAPGGGAPPAPGGGAPAATPFAGATGGSDGVTVTDAEYTGNQAAKTGMYALLKTDIFNMLCIPPINAETDLNPDTLSAAATLCVDRRAMLLVDPPHGWNSLDAAVTGAAAPPVSGDNATNAALYFPRIKLSDPLQNGNLTEFPPSGAVAGVMARTDGQRGVWKAPAGIDASLNGVRDLSVHLTDVENGELNPLGINCLRTFPVIGSVVWGARTLRGSDVLANQWKYVPVRRLALFLEESLYRGTKWVVFEPNDEPLWAAIRLNVGAFMNSLFRQGAFQGRTPNDAYFVKCDKENNPQNDINRGIVNILVGFAPLKPAEFVIIHIQQLAGQLQV